MNSTKSEPPGSDKDLDVQPADLDLDVGALVAETRQGPAVESIESVVQDHPPPLLVGLEVGPAHE